ncbi:MAG: DUF2029 domain-containing protein [Bacteroidales bacterium]|nr:DUF2029 domain-containing protein [Bacteroidales bacterium]
MGQDKAYSKLKISGLIKDPVFLVFFLVGIITIGLSVYNYVLPTYLKDGEFHSHYNNYLIFKGSFHHLINLQDLYVSYPTEYFDLYKYSPTFALLMAPLAYLPDVLGLILWNLINAFVFLYALWNFSFKNNRVKIWVVGFVLLALITSMQNAQSNALIAGLMILGFSFAEKQKFLPAAFLITLTFFIKIFGIAGLAIFIFYSDKWKSALYIFISFLILAILPLIVIPFHHLLELYQSWISMLQADHIVSFGFSAAGILSSWFNIENVKNWVLIFGIIGFFIPFIKINQYKSALFRLWVLAYILIWVVIFNHKAESPTFIIAVSGVAIWYFSQKRNYVNLFLLLLTFIFTVLSPTDLFPSMIREEFVNPYSIMALPCLLVWFKLLIDFLRLSEGLRWRILQ